MVARFTICRHAFLFPICLYAQKGEGGADPTGVACGTILCIDTSRRTPMVFRQRVLHPFATGQDARENTSGAATHRAMLRTKNRFEVALRVRDGNSSGLTRPDVADQSGEAW